MKLILKKIAWIRDEGYPVGVPAPGSFKCTCGARLPARIGQVKNIPCACGMVYDGCGWVIKGAN